MNQLKWVPGGDFDAAWASRETLRLDGVAVEVISHPEFIRLSQASGRPQDLEDARSLEAPEPHGRDA